METRDQPRGIISDSVAMRGTAPEQTMIQQNVSYTTEDYWRGLLDSSLRQQPRPPT